MRAAEKHGINMKRSIMIGDKDSDMQAVSNAGIGISCHYLPDGHVEVMFSGQPAKGTLAQSKLITAAILPDQFTQVGDKVVAIKQVSTGKLFPVGVFHVEPA